MNKQDYALLDTGNLLRLEQVGAFRLVRPALNAFWRPALPENEWKCADAVFVRNPQSGGGTWNGGQRLPSAWSVGFNGLTLRIKPTNFGHLGVFPEHAALWPWIQSLMPQLGKEPPILNLFAYTGALSLQLAKMGAKVTHCDSAQGIVDWAKDNLRLNPEIPQSIRWMVDDAFRFVVREGRRETAYRGVILDPPSFGRGAQGQIWKIEDQLPELLMHCREVLAKSGTRFLILTCHTPGFTPVILERMLQDAFAIRGAVFDSGELCTKQTSGAKLPSGTFARVVLN